MYCVQVKYVPLRSTVVGDHYKKVEENNHSKVIPNIWLHLLKIVSILFTTTHTEHKPCKRFYIRRNTWIGLPFLSFSTEYTFNVSHPFTFVSEIYLKYLKSSLFEQTSVIYHDGGYWYITIGHGGNINRPGRLNRLCRLRETIYVDPRTFTSKQDVKS